MISKADIVRKIHYLGFADAMSEIVSQGINFRITTKQACLILYTYESKYYI